MSVLTSVVLQLSGTVPGICGAPITVYYLYSFFSADCEILEFKDLVFCLFFHIITKYLVQNSHYVNVAK